MAADKPETLSTFEFFRKFPDEAAARKFFEARRWGDEPVCGHCGSVNVVECKDHKPMPYRCRDCRKHFSVRTGTVLAESRLPLIKWLLAIFMLTSARKGIPSTQMARELGITQKASGRIFIDIAIPAQQLDGIESQLGGRFGSIENGARSILAGRLSAIAGLGHGIDIGPGRIHRDIHIGQLALDQLKFTDGTRHRHRPGPHSS